MNQIAKEEMVPFASSLLSDVSYAANKGVATTEQIVTALTAAGGSMKAWGLEGKIPEQIGLITTMLQYGFDASSIKTTMSSTAGGPGLGGPATMTKELATALAKNNINLPASTFEDAGLYKTGALKNTPKPDKEVKASYMGADIGAGVLGISTEQFKKNWDTSAPTELLAVLDKLSSLDMTNIDKSTILGLITGTRAAREFPKMGGVGALDYYNTMVTGLTEEFEKGGLAADLYATKSAGLEGQWQIMANRADMVKILLGDMFMGPITEGVKRFSDSLRGTVDWLKIIIDNSRFPDGTLNSWRAIQQVIDALKEKLGGLSGAFQAAGIVAGISAVSSGLSGIVAVATGATTGIGAVVGAAALLVVGLGAIGYSLDPEKFTYFNTIAGDAIRGVTGVVTELVAELAAGDWGAAATTLKEAFTASVDYIKGINWSELGGEIVTMIVDGAKAIIDTAFKIGDWIYTNAKAWIDGGGPLKLGESIGKFIGDGINSLIKGTNFWDVLSNAWGTISNWLKLGTDILAGITVGLVSGLYTKIQAPVNNMFVNLVADICIMVSKIGEALATSVLGGLTAIAGPMDAFVTKLGQIGVLPSTMASNFNDIAKKGTIEKSVDGIYFADSSTGKMAGDSQRYFTNTPEGIAMLKEYYGNLGYVVVNLGEYSTSIQSNTKTTISQAYDLYKAKQKTTALTEAYNTSIQTATTSISDRSKYLSGVQVKGESWTELNARLGVDPDTAQPYNPVEYSKYQESTKDQPLFTDTAATEISKKLDMYNPDFVYTGFTDAVNKQTDATLKGYDNLNTVVEAWRKSNLMNVGIDRSKLDMMTGDMILELGQFEMGMDGVMSNFPIAGENLKTKGTEAGQELVNGATAASTTLNGTMDAVGQSTIKYSNTAATALRLGAEVGARFFTDAGNAVSIGMTKSGQEIAVIGQVAQRQFEQAGGSWVVKTDSAAVSHANIVGLSAEQFKGKMVESGDYQWMSGKAASDAIANGGVMSAGSFSAGVNGATGSFSTGVGGATSTFSSGVSAATSGMVGALGTAAGSLVGAVGSMYGTLFGSMGSLGTFKNMSTSSAVGSIGTATQTFNDCMFEGFTDTCTNMNINALKYTSPSGVVSYVNPMDNSGVRTLGGSSSSGSSGSSGYQLPAIFRARGGLIDKGPELSIIGEKGTEMVLPNNLTEMFVRLAAMGFKGNSTTSDAPVVVILQLDGEEMTRVVLNKMKAKLNQQGYKSH
jgi:hypothetical protein